MILLTGGAGFIGSVFLKYLNQKGRRDVIVVDRPGDDHKWKNLVKSLFVDFVHADELFSKGSASLTFPWHKIHWIFHFGACSSTTEVNVDYLLENNFSYSKKLFTMAINHQIPIVYASSGATYGDGALGLSDDHSSLHLLRPLNPYGYSKKLFDDWALSQVKRPPLWFGLKFFNVYGPNEYHKGSMRAVVHQAYQQIKEHRQVRLFKSYRSDFAHGEQRRDFIYVKDVASIIYQLAFECKDETRSGVYNVGTGQARSFNDLANACFSALGFPPNINYIEMPENLKNQYQYLTQANIDKLMSQLPHFKFMSMENAIHDYINKYLQGEDCYF